jgi:pimeloyl-ACP methyl ester carboxylesterase
MIFHWLVPSTFAALRVLIPAAVMLVPLLHGAAHAATPPQTSYRNVEVAGVRVFYREAGPADGPQVLLLHGFPASSHMFRDLIPALADRFHVIAPDYPGFGHSAMPAVDAFDYSFDHLAEVIDAFTARVGFDRYALYVQDYGAPIGFRLAVKHPERVRALVIQNGNAYDEGLREFWDPIKAYWRDPTGERRAAMVKALELEGTRWQYLHGARQPERISPDAWVFDQALLDRPGNTEIQLQLFYSYRTNPPRYAEWQAYFRRHQPPALIVWGRHDPIFPAEGAHPYARDLKNVELHLLDTGHFALEEDGPTIARLMRAFLERTMR